MPTVFLFNVCSIPQGWFFNNTISYHSTGSEYYDSSVISMHIKMQNGTELLTELLTLFSEVQHLTKMNIGHWGKPDLLIAVIWQISHKRYMSLFMDNLHSPTTFYVSLEYITMLIQELITVTQFIWQSQQIHWCMLSSEQVNMLNPFRFSVGLSLTIFKAMTKKKPPKIWLLWFVIS